MKILTYSAIKMFEICPFKYYLRYIKNLVPYKESSAFRFGNLIHNCLELWHRKISNNLPEILKSIEEDYSKKIKYVKKNSIDEKKEKEKLQKIKIEFHQARMMMTGYVLKYPKNKELFNVIQLEQEFAEMPIINSLTGELSPHYSLSGKIDGLVRMKDSKMFFIMEHKTTARNDDLYKQILWSDFQSLFYSFIYSKFLKIPISGVLYNILEKTRLKQIEGETEKEYQERYTALCAKSKKSKSLAKRKIPENNENYEKRLLELFQKENGTKFFRKNLFFSDEQYERLQRSIFILSEEIRTSKERNFFLQNSASCKFFNQACPYLKICSSQMNETIIEKYYKKVEPHEELEKNLEEKKGEK